MRNSKSIALAVMLAVPLAFWGCSKGQAEKGGPAPKTAAKEAIATKTALVEAREVERSVEATGTLLPYDEVAVSSEIAGTVEKLFADLGDSVQAGQVLAVLDQREAKLGLGDAQAAHQTNLKTLEKEKARLGDAEVTFNRYDELFKKGMVTASQHDNAKTQLDVAVASVKEAEARVEQSSARLDLAKKRLSDTVIKAAITGSVKKRSVSAGETVKDKTPFFTLVSTGVLKFRGTVAESFAPAISAGQSVSISVDAYRDRTFPGKVTRISPAVDADSRTLELEASVPNPKGVLKPGFFAKGLITTRKEANVPFVPDAAVYSFVGVTKVFTIDNNVAKEVQVKTGVRQGGMVEAPELKPGSAVAIENLANIFDGAQVSVKK